MESHWDQKINTEIQHSADDSVLHHVSFKVRFLAEGTLAVITLKWALDICFAHIFVYNEFVFASQNLFLWRAHLELALLAVDVAQMSLKVWRDRERPAAEVTRVRLLSCRQEAHLDLKLQISQDIFMTTSSFVLLEIPVIFQNFLNVSQHCPCNPSEHACTQESLCSGVSPSLT